MIKQFFTNYISGILFGLIVLIISVVPISAENQGSFFLFPGADKIVHAAIYGLFSLLILRDYLKINPFHTGNILLILGGILIYSLMIEGMQKWLTSYRSGEWMDLLANFAGIIGGTLLLLIYRKIKY